MSPVRTAKRPLFAALACRAASPRSLFLTGALLALAGCASTEEMALLRESPSFQTGYGDGCSTAIEEDKSFSTKQERDAHAFETDDAYRFGWRQGYLECSHQTPEAKDGGRILGERNEY